MSEPTTMTGAPVKGSDGEMLGTVDAVYLANDTDRPEWVAVRSGLCGSIMIPTAGKAVTHTANGQRRKNRS